MGDNQVTVAEAAIAIFKEELPILPHVEYRWSTSNNCQCRISDRIDQWPWPHVLCGAGMVDIYFHAERAIIDVEGKIGWDRFPYSDPAFPNELIDQMLRGVLHRLNAYYPTSVPALQTLKKRVDSLLRKDQVANLRLNDRNAGILVLGGD